MGKDSSMTFTRINFDISFSHSHLRDKHIVPQLLRPDGITTLAVAVASCFLFPALISDNHQESSNYSLVVLKAYRVPYYVHCFDQLITYVNLNVCTSSYESW